MKLNSVLTAVALVSGSLSAWADSAFISNLPASDLSALQLAAVDSAAPGSALTFSLGSNLSLSNIRITVLDAGPQAMGLAGQGNTAVLLDHSLTAGNAYFFQVKGSLFTDTAEVTPVPEAGGLAMMLSGLALMASKLSRRRLAQ